ncbi:MAG: putative DNA binding domain-containing protein [Myxococcus sp.]|nr:putative DNA binding domain-containing protein [Myxococcus sp.]
MTTLMELDELLKSRESEHLEFKLAERSFSVDKLTDYCVALANEGGGRLILGVSDRPPRRVVGTQAFQGNDVAYRVLQKIHLRVEVEELAHPSGRVVIVHVPARPLGVPVHVDGRYLVRSGENLVPMGESQLRKIFNEATPDYSATAIPDASIADLDAEAIRRFRMAWARKSGRPEVEDGEAEAALRDAELIIDGRPTIAALVLLGSARALSRWLPCAELVHEFRESEDEPPRRTEWRQAFMLVLDETWRAIDAFNRQEQLEDGFFRWSIPMFREHAVREAVLNVVAHRDYRSQAASFIRQSPTELRITSPGGFPDGVTPENILTRTVPRNRRLAEALSRCGLVERAGSGADLLFRLALSDGKEPPDFSQSNDREVTVLLHGQVAHRDFIQFLAAINKEKQRSFGVLDLLVLSRVHRGQKLDAEFHARAEQLEKHGVLERRSKREWLLAARFFRLAGKPGEYTRRRGLKAPEREMLLLKHLEQFGPSAMADLIQVLPSLDRKEVLRLLKGLRAAQKVVLTGSKRGAKWALAVCEPVDNTGDSEESPRVEHSKTGQKVGP